MANKAVGQQGSVFNFNYPGPADNAQLGLGLGLNRRGRGRFRGAAEHGQLNQFLAQHPGIQQRIAAFAPGSYRSNLYDQYSAQNQQAMLGNQPAPIDPRLAATPVGINPPPPYQSIQQPPTPSDTIMPGGGPGGNGIGPGFFDQRNQLLQAYQSPMSDIYQAYMRSFNKGGPLDIPSFQELYGSYRDVAEKEAQRRSADINEAFGARGARYGSDVLNAQNSLQRDLAGDLRNASGQFLTGLRQQQFNEMYPIGQAQQSSNDIAMQRLLAMYAGQTAPPPLFTGQMPQFQQPTTVLY